MTDSKFRMPEARVEVGRGFLKEYWKDEKPLAMMSGRELPWYYLQQGLRTISALPMSNTITIMTIAISLFLFSGFLLILKNTDRFISNIGNSLEVTVFLKDSAGSEDVLKFSEELKRSPAIRSVSYVSKEDALATLRGYLQEDSSFLDSLAGTNPLPASLDILLHADEVGVNQMETIVNRLREHSLVEDIAYGSEWVGKIQGIIKIFRFFGLVILMTILATVVFLIANTIKLVIYSRRNEIEIMKLVGSTDGFIKIPFFIGGVVQGTIGASVALILVACAVWLMNFELARSTVFGATLPSFLFLTPLSICFIVSIGIIVGAVGSLFAVRQFLDV